MYPFWLFFLDTVVKPKRKSSFRIRFILVLSGIALISTALVSLLMYYNARRALEESNFRLLTAIRDTKKSQLLDLFNRSVQQSQALPGMLKELMYQNQYPTSMNALENNSFLTEARRLIVARQFQAIIVTDNFSDAAQVMRINPFDQNSWLVEMLPASHFPTLKPATISGSNDSLCFMDIESFPDVDSLPLFPLSYTFRGAGQKFYTISCLISVKKINNIMTSGQNWSEAGFGASGEVYLVGRDYRMRSDSRFLIESPERYFYSIKAAGTPPEVIESIRIANSTVRLQPVYTKGATDAISGLSDTRFISDYRGYRVLSSFAPLDFYGLRLAVLAEIDEAEAFSTIYQLKERLLMISLLIILLSTGAAVLFTRLSLKRISDLAVVASGYQNGNFSLRSPVPNNDEISQLSETLNAMAQKISDDTESLHHEIEERSAAQTALVESRNELRALASHLQVVREEERKMIAREIHDVLGQSLNVLKLKLEILRNEVPDSLSPDFGMELKELIKITGETLTSTKQLITNLRPQLLDDLGLCDAIGWFLRDYSNRTGLKTHFHASCNPESLHESTSIALYRIVQEAASNTFRYASASLFEVTLEISGSTIILTITDNGVGISEEDITKSGSFGILGMKERAESAGGSFTISPAKPKGTKILVSVPGREVSS